MPDHCHFFLTRQSDEPISNFIGALLEPYVQAMNQEHGRSATRFEGRFRHALIDRQEYVIHLCHYVHLNPMEARLVTPPEDWQYSNFSEWIGQPARALKDETLIRDRFLTPASCQSFVAYYQGGLGAPTDAEVRLGLANMCSPYGPLAAFHSAPKIPTQTLDAPERLHTLAFSAIFWYNIERILYGEMICRSTEHRYSCRILHWRINSEFKMDKKWANIFDHHRDRSGPILQRV